MIRNILKKMGIIKPAGNETGMISSPAFSNSGLTLIELMVVMVLSLILVGAAFMAYLAHSKTSNEQTKVLALQQDIRAVMDMMDRDIRNSGSNRTGANLLAITANSSGPSSIALNMDLNWDGDTVGDTDEAVSYRLNGTILERTDLGVTTPLVNNVSVFQVIYFDLNNLQINPTGSGGFLSTTEAARVLSVQVTMALRSDRPDPDSGQFFTKQITRRMQSRNREMIHKDM